MKKNLEKMLKIVALGISLVGFGKYFEYSGRITEIEDERKEAYSIQDEIDRKGSLLKLEKKQGDFAKKGLMYLGLSVAGAGLYLNTRKE